MIVVRVEGDTAIAAPAVDAVDGVLQVEVRGHELIVSTTDGPATVSGVAVALSKCGTKVRDLTLRSPTLDDVFLELTGNRFEHEDDREATR